MLAARRGGRGKYAGRFCLQVWKWKYECSYSAYLNAEKLIKNQVSNSGLSASIMEGKFIYLDKFLILQGHFTVSQCSDERHGPLNNARLNLLVNDRR